MGALKLLDLVLKVEADEANHPVLPMRVFVSLTNCSTWVIRTNVLNHLTRKKILWRFFFFESVQHYNGIFTISAWDSSLKMAQFFKI